jgi:hypothetical protein
MHALEEAYEMGVHVALRNAGIVKTAISITESLRRAAAKRPTFGEALKMTGAATGIGALGGAGASALLSEEPTLNRNVLTGLGAGAGAGVGAAGSAGLLRYLAKNHPDLGTWGRRFGVAGTVGLPMAGGVLGGILAHRLSRPDNT